MEEHNYIVVEDFREENQRQPLTPSKILYLR